MLSRHEGRDDLDRAFEHRRERDVLVAELDVAPRHARDVQQVVDEPSEMAGVAFQHLLLAGGVGVP